VLAGGVIWGARVCLRALLLERGVTLDRLAEAVRVDPKTVERWITKGRVPHRRHRYDVWETSTPAGRS
jgi:hypothetical protein